jgi:hypothetical protein
MCRTKELGGRRCPQHTDPVKHAAYNARRRELYAVKKGQSALNPLDMFLPLDAVRSSRKGDKSLRASLNHDSKVFFNSLDAFNPPVDPKASDDEWDDYEWDYPQHGTYSDKNNNRHRMALLSYTHVNYSYVRDYLYGVKISSSGKEHVVTPEKRAEYEDTIQLMDSALEKAVPPKTPRLVYRGLKIPHRVDNVDSWLDENFPVGGVVSHKSYLSTSADPETALKFSTPPIGTNKGVVIEMVTRQGASLGKGTSHFGNLEMEVLMPRDAKFVVHSVNRDVDYQYTYKGEVKTGKRHIVRFIDEGTN